MKTSILLLVFAFLSAGLLGQDSACAELPSQNSSDYQNGELVELCMTVNGSTGSCAPQLVYNSSGSIPQSTLTAFAQSSQDLYFNVPMTDAVNGPSEITVDITFAGGTWDLFQSQPVFLGPNLETFVSVVFGDQTWTGWSTASDEIVGGFEQQMFRTFSFTTEFGQSWPSINVTNSEQIKISFHSGFITATPVQFEVASRVIVTGSETLGDPNWITLAPAAPQLILRDPPGDGSYTFIQSDQQTCYGQSISVMDLAEGSIWASARVGASGSAGFLVETDYEAFVELSAGLTMGSSQTSSTTNEVCITTSDYYQTGTGGQLGSSGDVFIGSALEYAYGKYITLSYQGCANPTNIEEEVVFALTGNAEQEFIYTESHILGLIDDLNAQLSILDPASDEYQFTLDQLEVWEQAIALNDQLIAEATNPETTSFAGNTAATFTHTGSNSTQKSLEMNVYVDATFGIEMGISAGGSGVSAGAQARIRQETGTGSSAGNTSTTTIGYVYSDDDATDSFAVTKTTDPVFGTPIFSLNQAGTESSCPYEGGYQIDQPEIFFQDGSNVLTLNDIPTGTEPTFQIQLCNPSTFGRYYHLKVNPNSNPNGAILEGFGENLSATDDGFSIYLNAGECLENVTITFSQTTSSILDYENVELYLYALCQPGSAPIYQSIFVNAHFSDGTGIHDVNASPIVVDLFPNPTDGPFTIQLSGVETHSAMYLTDTTGRVHQQLNVPPGASAHSLDASALAAGMYLLTLENPNQRSVKRVVVR